MAVNNLLQRGTSVYIPIHLAGLTQVKEKSVIKLVMHLEGTIQDMTYIRF